MNFFPLLSKSRPAALAVAILVSSSGSTSAQSPHFPPIDRPTPAQLWPPGAVRPIEFFPRNGGWGDSLGIHWDTPGRKLVRNDEVRSLVLGHVRPGTVIRLFDDPKGRGTDDWIEIRVKAYSPRIVIDTLERSRSDFFIDVIFHRKNGLDGKVSFVQVHR